MNPLVLALVAGALAVDERAGWQGLLAQPVFAALLVGLITGEVYGALVVGVVLELVYLGIIPLRGRKRPNVVAGAVVGSAVTSTLVQSGGGPGLVLLSAIGVFLGLLAAEAGSRLANPFFSGLDKSLGQVRFLPSPSARYARAKLLFLHVGAVVYILLVEAVVVFCLLIGALLIGQWLADSLRGAAATGVERWHYLMPVFGAASLIYLYWLRHLKRVLVATTVIAALILWMQ